MNHRATTNHTTSILPTSFPSIVGIVVTKLCAPRMGSRVPCRYSLMLASNLLLSAAAGSNLPSKPSPGIVPRRHLRPCCWPVSQRGPPHLHRGRRNIGPSCRANYIVTRYISLSLGTAGKHTLQDIFVKTNPLCTLSSKTYKIEDTNSSASAQLLRCATFEEYRALSPLLQGAWRNAGLVHV
jgi:hypothetical protein